MPLQTSSSHGEEERGSAVVREGASEAGATNRAPRVAIYLSRITRHHCLKN